MNKLTNVPVAQRPASASAWRFLTETEGNGLWDLVQNADGTVSAHFHDDHETIPLNDMAYTMAQTERLWSVWITIIALNVWSTTKKGSDHGKNCSN